MNSYSPDFYQEILNAMSMRPETRQSMEMLFAAKWNLPKAAKNCGLTEKEMKIRLTNTAFPLLPISLRTTDFSASLAIR